MSSTGTIFETTPLLPWRPAILSPGCRRRLTARKTLTIFSTPAGNSSPCVSFFFFSSNARSKLCRVCSSASLINSSSTPPSSFTGEPRHVAHRALPAVLDARGGVLHIGSLPAEDRAQQLFFGREGGLA